MNFKKKIVTVVGLGKSGFAAAKFLHEQGAKVRVTDASEKKEVLENAFFLRSLGVRTQTGAHTADFIEGSNLIVVSPGVPKKSLPILEARKRKIPVISEVELAASVHKGILIAITGSNGKTTSCNLLHEILKSCGKRSILCGNVGYAFLDAIKEIDSKTYTVLELSSFQLEDCQSLKPQVSAVLNISPNHLDRHESMSRYARAKFRIASRQTSKEYTVLNAEDARVRKMATSLRSKKIFFSKKALKEGMFFRDGKIYARFQNQEKQLLTCENFKLRGEHNLENILACATIAYALKLDFKKVQSALDCFETLEHRIESAGTLKDIHFINDSKSTTIASTKAAIEASGPPLILIAGGRDKGSDFKTIEPVLLEKVKLVILYGESKEKIAKSWTKYKNFKFQHAFKDAVNLAFGLANAGDKILLSPMCASFDQFSSFEERGLVFKQHVKDLSGLHGKA